MKKKNIKKIKLYFETLAGYLLALACFYGAYHVYPASFLDFKDTTKTIGKIIDTKIITKNSSVAGKYRLNLSIFTFKISGFDKILEIYNSKQDYSIYQSSLTIDDTITVYFKSIPKDKQNVAAYQIEKNSKIILRHDIYTTRNRIAFALALLGGLIFIVLPTLRLKKVLKAKPLS